MKVMLVVSVMCLDQIALFFSCLVLKSGTYFWQGILFGGDMVKMCDLISLPCMQG